jgi:hypothetical protein
MWEREIQLGDEIDDYCTKCRLLTNHGVVAIVGGEVKKVRCNTCLFEHEYRHGKGGRKRKKDDVKSLFEQVLKGMPKAPSAPSAPAPDKKKVQGK